MTDILKTEYSDGANVHLPRIPFRATRGENKNKNNLKQYCNSIRR